MNAKIYNGKVDKTKIKIYKIAEYVKEGQRCNDCENSHDCTIIKNINEMEKKLEKIKYLKAVKIEFCCDKLLMLHRNGW
ncbi:MAG: hypothetical protein FWC41_00200 [Firmicutes bacterium]|nr:hypothetical protein [Bacillota bacterium]